MTPRKMLPLVAASLALFALPVAAMRAPAALAPVQVSIPIPVTSESRPFLYAQKYLEPVGYVEEEYFLSGMANRCRPSSDQCDDVPSGGGWFGKLGDLAADAGRAGTVLPDA
jgi:Alpha/beta hydrolase domain